MEQCYHLETVKVLDAIGSNRIKMTLPENMPLVLLHICPILKHLHTPRHSADARLLLERPIVCRSLETFCCQVVGGNRLTVDEQVAYDSWTITPMRDGEAATSTTTTATALETAQEEKRSQVEKYQTGEDLHRYIYATFQG